MQLKLHFKSIRTKLLLLFGGLLLAVCLGLSLFYYLSSTEAIRSTVDESLLQMARESAKVVQSRVDGQFNALEALAETDIIKSDTLTVEEKLASVQGEVKRSGHLRIGIADPSGNAIYTNGSTADLADRAHFKKAMSGERAVSDPIVSKIDGDIILTYAVPIKDGNAVKGVLLAARDGNNLSDITSDIKYGKNGNAFMINKNGTTVAHQDKNSVINMDNIFENAKNDPELVEFAQLQQRMVEGMEGTGEYTYKGVTNYMGYAPVPGTNWALGITAPKDEVMEKINEMTIALWYGALGLLAGGLIIAFFFATSISKPLTGAAKFLSVVATGDFTGAVPDRWLKMEDEIGMLANALNTMQYSIKNMIGEVTEKSIEMGQMLVSITNEMTQLNQSIEEISAITEEVSAGTEETASSTEEMSATSEQIEKVAEDIATKAQESAVTVNTISNMAVEMKENAVTSAQNAGEMYERVKNELENALEKSKSVTKINELSESILEITSQTNLLALNAAIEAARAGEAGRGFAVVAEEIRKLAESSSEAVSTIKEVTDEVLEAVQNLAAGSNEITEFIDQQVMNDYSSLVKTGEDYSQNSLSIKDMVSEFSATSEELLASVHNMVTALDEITKATSEGAEGTSQIAQETTQILQISDQVSRLAESAKEKSDHLISRVSKFKF